MSRKTDMSNGFRVCDQSKQRNRSSTLKCVDDQGTYFELHALDCNDRSFVGMSFEIHGTYVLHTRVVFAEMIGYATIQFLGTWHGN